MKQTADQLAYEILKVRRDAAAITIKNLSEYQHRLRKELRQLSSNSSDYVTTVKLISANKQVLRQCHRETTRFWRYQQLYS